MNITGFRDAPLDDAPMLEVLRRASEGCFVPLTVGGGIRECVDPDGTKHTVREKKEEEGGAPTRNKRATPLAHLAPSSPSPQALDVAAEYFRSGADKVSIGGDAVEAAAAWLASGGACTGATAIEQISWAYGAQAVVVSIDPRRVYVADPGDTERPTVRTAIPGPRGEEFCWWQCTVKGGREGRDVDATELARAAEALGAGEILLNCIDRDGTGAGFDTELINAVTSSVSIPVIASSGACAPSHFVDVFEGTSASAALAAGIFHRGEVGIDEVKAAMAAAGLPTRAA